MSSRRPRGLSADDVAVWEDITRTVRPLRRKAVAVRLEPPTPASLPTPIPPVRPATAAPQTSFSPAPVVSGPRIVVTPAPAAAGPADRGNEKRIRRGRVEIDAKLDLHGYTQDQAFAALTHVLFAAAARGDGVVLVVTGKGGRRVDGEAAPGVLKRRLPDWLASAALKPIVSGMAQAHARHGGAGAVYVFIRRARAKV